MKEHLSLRQHLKFFKDRFKKKKPDAVSAPPQSPEVISLEEQEINPYEAIGSDQLYEQIFPDHFSSVHEARQFGYGGTDLRLFGRRLDRSTSYDSLCFSNSTASELTSIADQSFDMTLMHSFNSGQDPREDRSRDSLSIVREELGLNSNPPSNFSESESDYDSLDHVAALMTLRPWAFGSDQKRLVRRGSSAESRLFSRQLSFSELMSTPLKNKRHGASRLRPRAPVPSPLNVTTAAVSTQSYASEVLQRMMSRYHEGDSPVSADSSIELSRASVSTRRSFGIYNSPASSYNTVHSTASSRNTDALYQHASSEFYTSPTTNTTSSDTSFLPPPLNTPNISPEDSTHDTDCILAPPAAFQDSPVKNGVEEGASGGSGTPVPKR